MSFPGLRHLNTRDACRSTSTSSQSTTVVYKSTLSTGTTSTTIDVIEVGGHLNTRGNNTKSINQSPITVVVLGTGTTMTKVEAGGHLDTRGSINLSTIKGTTAATTIDVVEAGGHLDTRDNWSNKSIIELPTTVVILGTQSTGCTTYVVEAGGHLNTRGSNTQSIIQSPPTVANLSTKCTTTVVITRTGTTTRVDIKNTGTTIDVCKDCGHLTTRDT